MEMTWVLLAQEAGGGLAMVFPIVAMFAIMYFLMIRPNIKQQKQHEDFLSKLKVGDDVITNAGFLGKILELKEGNPSIVVLDVGEGGQKVKVRYLKNRIAALSSQVEKNTK
jgi:preprotein translocase subunit YajC